MMHWLLILPLALLGGMCFRIRGGWSEGKSWQLPGQVSRLAWGLACGTTVWVAACFYAWWIALLVGVLTWLSTMAGLHDTIDMGHNEGSFARDFGVGTLHGLLLGAAAALP